MKIIKFIMGFLILAMTYSISLAGVVQESCQNGIYKDYYKTYGQTCNRCGYYSNTFYQGNTYGIWDYFLNTQKKEYLITTNGDYSYSKIHNIGGNITYDSKNYVGSNSKGLTANWIPANRGINGNNDTVIFYIPNVKWNTASDLNKPLGMVEFKFRTYNVNSAGEKSASLGDKGFVYLYGRESVDSQGTTWLNSEYKYDSGEKKYSLSSTYDYKECYVMLPAWCGDGKLNGAEVCDPNDPNKTNWGNNGCDVNTCRPLNTPTPTPVCKTMTANPSSGDEGLRSTITCTGENVDESKYRIDCGNGQTINGKTGQCNYSTKGSYTAKCYVNNNITSSSCTKIITVSDDSTPSSGTPSSGTPSSGTPSSGTPSSGTPSSGTPSSGTPSSGTPSSGTPSSGTPSGGGGGGICGDGVLDRPNEECDFGGRTWPNWCTIDCKLKVTTIPSDGVVELNTSGNIVIGHEMNPYSTYSLSKPYIKNVSGSDLYLGEICLSRTGTPIVLTGDNDLNCSAIGSDGILRAGDTKYLEYPNFIGTTTPLASGTTYADNMLTTTIKQNGILYSEAYFASKLRVRVAKSSVGTTGGGTSYVEGSKDISNVTEVGGNSNDKNFVGAGVNEGNLGSYTSEVSEGSSVQEVGKEGEKYNEGVTGIVGNSSAESSSLSTTNNIGVFTSYNGLSNAFILKDSNFELNSNNLSGLSGARTYIIENADLIINGDVNYTDNIAFVVRGGNIKINSNVKKLTGTFITIPLNNIGGKIDGIGENSLEVLNVQGSLYGNSNGLVSKRTYIKQNSAGLLDIGTVVSFGSSVFRDPAPLTATFISEYLNANKVAQ